MAKKRAPESTNPANRNPGEMLDSLNGRLRRKPGALRRSMEADLEEKARQRRTGQAPTSSAWQK